MTKITNELKLQINALTTAGIKPTAIADQLGLKYNSVKSFVRRSKLIANLPPKVVVRHNYFLGRTAGIIRRYLEDFPTATDEQVLEACGLTCSRQYLNKYLNANGLGRVKAKRNILLSKANRLKRIAFAKKMLRRTDEQLNLILWSDETMVKSYPNGEAVFYRSRRDLPEIVSPQVQQSGSGTMLWGCLSYHAYGPLVSIKGYINHEKYLQLLKSTVKPEMDASSDLKRVLSFQQDNAKPHKTPDVMNFLENWGYEVLDWPPQSPDLSPIENIWNAMKMKLKKLRPRPRTPATMRNAMMEIWDGLEDKMRKKVVGSFKVRLVQCIKNKGGLVHF